MVSVQEKGVVVLVEEYVENALTLREMQVGRFSEEHAVKMVLQPLCR